MPRNSKSKSKGKLYACNWCGRAGFELLSSLTKYKGSVLCSIPQNTIQGYERLIQEDSDDSSQEWIDESEDDSQRYFKRIREDSEELELRNKDDTVSSFLY